MQRKQEATDSPESFDDTNSVPWTKERVLEFRKAEPPVSVWWVVLTQMSVGLMTVFVAWLLGAKFASMASLGYGSFCVVLPSIIFARGITSKTVRETEAEAVAFVVGKTIGLETGRASADYIHLYHGNASLLTESLEVIQKTSAVILSALESPAAEAAEEPEPELAQAS